MTVTFNVNPGVRGISAVISLIHKNFPNAEVDPYSQVSLMVKIDQSQVLEFLDLMNESTLFYTEVTISA